MATDTGYDADYQGARFYKCDLQMGTPGDAQHWRGAVPGNTEEDRNAAAEKYARRCFEEGLEVIGITNHVFLDSEDFIPRLRAAATALEGEFGYHLTVLPGWELTVNAGHGLHVLALFDEGTPLAQVSDVLSQCGCPLPRVVDGVTKASTATLEMVLSEVQVEAKKRGISGVVVAAHPLVQNGLLNDKSHGKTFQQQAFLLEELLAIESPVPPEQLSSPWKERVLRTAKCEREWRRANRRLAAVCSSDTKAYSKVESLDRPNYIGSRFTWIRMSRPSIEALRQAFLDPASRIAFGDMRPDLAQTHRFIRRLEVNGAEFVADQSFDFSRNLTTIIGGRGSGKSALVEFLRVGLGQPAPQGEDPRRQHDTLSELLKPASAQLRVHVERDGLRFVAQSQAGARPASFEGTSHAPATYFPVRVFSQHELAEIANDWGSIRKLVDDGIVTNLADLAREEEDLRRELRAINAKLMAHVEDEARRKQLETEVADLALRTESITKQSGPLQAWRVLAQEEAFLERGRSEQLGNAAAVRASLHELTTNATALPADADRWPNLNVLKALSGEIDGAVVALRGDIEKAVANFESTMKSLLQERGETRAWRARLADAKAKAEEAKADMAAKGIELAKLEEYELQRRAKAAQLLELKARADVAKELRVKRDGREQTANAEKVVGLMTSLELLVEQRTELRQEEAAALNGRITKTQTGSPFAEVVVEAGGDLDAIGECIDELKWTGRRPSQADLDDLKNALRNACRTDRRSAGEVLLGWRDALSAGSKPDAFPSTWKKDDARTKSLQTALTEEVVQNLCLVRADDKVGIKLRRASGELVGLVPEPGAGSIGQKATAVLAVLLARGDEPLVIDQPEDDLDNAFLYKDLVPLLRTQKERRQIIVVTHNANIPVNADAELVIALDGSGGKGRLRVHEPAKDGSPTVEAIGALDRAEVVAAVSEILEGSEEAFRRRREKYGY